MQKTQNPDLNFSTLTTCIQLAPSDIVCCAAEGNYTYLHLGNGRDLLICKQIGYLETILPDELFMRVHRSYLVNVQYVSGLLRHQSRHLLLKTGRRIPVSRRRWKVVNKFLR